MVAKPFPEKLNPGLEIFVRRFLAHPAQPQQRAPANGKKKESRSPWLPDRSHRAKPNSHARSR